MQTLPTVDTIDCWCRPGLKRTLANGKFYADAEFRVYHYANAAPSVAAEGTQGQLVAPVLFKFIVSYSF